MKKEFLPIGTMVRVYKTVYAFYTSENERVIGFNQLKNPILGVIVGATYIIEGSYHKENHSPFGDGDDSSYLVESKRHFVYLVRQGLLNRPLKVLPEDISSVVSLAFTSGIPLFYAERPPVSEKDRRFLRHLMSTIPRDANGRWLK